MQGVDYEDEEMLFAEGSSPFAGDPDDDEADTVSEEDEDEQDAEESGEESEQQDESDHEEPQERHSSPPSEHEETEENHVADKRKSPAMAITPVVPIRAVSPATLRRAQFTTPNTPPHKSYSIDPICAFPHPVPSHSLAASRCMSHLLTGSDDGFVRDYDFYASCNGKVLLTAPQRQHCGLGEGVMKGGVLRMWWENPSGEGKEDTAGGDVTPGPANALEGGAPSPVYCMAVHSDALWGLSGTASGNINLFTIRHDPGRVHFVLRGHKGPTSGLALSADEKKSFHTAHFAHSADLVSAFQEWDLNVGQIVRRYPSHGAQLVSIGVRPISATIADAGSPAAATLARQSQANGTGRRPSEAQPGGSPRSERDDYDPLFDDDPDPDAVGEHDPGARGPTAPVWRSGMPTLDPDTYERYSHNILMTAAIDGQITIWDRRVAGSAPGSGVGRLEIPEKTPPWCVSVRSSLWLGPRVLIGFLDWDRRAGQQMDHNCMLADGMERSRTLRNPPSSGAVSCVVAFPDGKHLAWCDNIRLWNVSAEAQAEAASRSRVAPFKIIAGHHGGTISQILVDATSRFMITASGNRGWFGESTRTVLVHEMKRVY
ncbi:Transcription factor spt8 [Ceratobasidium sp. 414]|nr:Transcription factor spt8 [Ceratobasidium sp. 414]